MITIKNLSKEFKGLKALNDINVQFNSGEIYGLMGPNGSGKSTLFNCIAGIINDFTGSIDSSTLDNYNQNIFYLPSELFFYPKMKGIEYIEFCMKASKIGKVNIMKWNELFNLPLDRYANDYSTGMKKKLMFLVIFILNKKIILLDEPFNGIDEPTTEFILQAFGLFSKKDNLIILSSHHSNQLSQCSNSIIYLKDGQIQKVFGSEEFSSLSTYIDQDILSKKIETLKEQIQLLPSNE